MQSSLLAIPITILILFLPGAALLAWQPRQGDAVERLAVALGLSAALAVLTALLGSLLGIQFNQTGVWLLLVGCLLVMLVGWWWRRVNPGWGWLAALGGFALIAGWRLFQARGLALPPWVDSVHHTLIVQLFLTNGGIPSGMQPQVDAPFFYHYLFHLLTALLSGLSGMAPERAVLVMGQVLNAAIGLSIYRLAKAIWGDWKRAALAALLTTFAFQMPAYYLSWGRFTLSAGMVLLPLALAEAIDLVQGDCEDPRACQTRLALLTAGTALAHYLTLALLGIFGVLLAGYWLWRLLRHKPSRVIWQTLIGLLAGVLIALPYLLRLWDFLPRYAGVELVSPMAETAKGEWVYLFEMLAPWRNRILLLLALPGLVWMLVKPNSRLITIWLFLIVLLALPIGLRFSPFRPDHLAILLFLPGALGLGDGLVHLGEWLSTRWFRIGWGVVGVLAVAIMVWGAIQTHQPINPRTLLADRADVEALAWVQKNTPETARFFINTTLWQTGSYRGVDGGYWLPVLAGRQTELPPAVYGYGSVDTIQWINDLAKQASRITACDTALWNLVEQAEITHVYLRAGRGSLQPSALAQCPGVLPVFARNGVTIYEIVK